MKPVAAVIIGSAAAHAVGSMILSGIVGGLLGVLASPILAIFGWFFIFPEALGVVLQWLSYRPGDWTYRIRFLLTSAAIAAVIVAPVGPKEQGSEMLWTVGHAAGAGLAAVVSGLVVQRFKHMHLQESPTIGSIESPTSAGLEG